ncbi:MAG: DUF460 domain-containing protein [Nanoarchaeota archaeon]
MQRTIVGIDPGTTTAFAVLDLKGSLLHVESLRVHDSAEVIKRIIAYGKPILVGCDKRNPPEAVAKIARSLGGRLISPLEDLKYDEKRLLVKEKTRNDHEFDAIASARHAQEKYAPLFEKIEKVLDKQDKRVLADEVKEFLIKNEELNINEAISILEAKEEKLERKKKREKEYSPLAKLKDELSVMEEVFSLKKEENQALKRRLREFEKRRATPSKSRDDLLREKEERIHFLTRKLQESCELVQRREKEIREWKNFLAGIGQDYVVVKKVADLETYKKGRLHDEIIFVEKADGALDDVSSLRIIITKDVPRNHKGIIFLDARLFGLKEKEDFVLVRREELDSALAKKEVLSKIIKDYQASRR